jgi:hypothetical protein
MLVDPQGDKLGDRRLSKEETLRKSFEDTDKRLEPYRLADQDELTKAEKRMGHPMSHTELIRRVTKLNPRIWAEDSNANPHTVVGFYTAKRDEKIYLGSFEKGWLPEFSIILTDRADLPVKHRKGWRTVLLSLIQQGYLSLDAVIEAFGDALGINAKYWQAQTRRYR